MSNDVYRDGRGMSSLEYADTKLGFTGTGGWVFCESAEKVQLRVPHLGIAPPRTSLTAAFRFHSPRRLTRSLLRLSSTVDQQNAPPIATEPCEFFPFWSECDLLTPFCRGFRDASGRIRRFCRGSGLHFGSQRPIFYTFTGFCRALLGARYPDWRQTHLIPPAAC